MEPALHLADQVGDATARFTLRLQDISAAVMNQSGEVVASGSWARREA